MSRTPIRILLQTTIVPTENDWSIARFSQLTRLLADEVDHDGQPLYEVTAPTQYSRHWTAAPSTSCGCSPSMSATG